MSKGYLGSFRTGWENENLARFILSKFSFVAEPSTISDDVGSDFFCTLFYVQEIENRKYLVPKNSFAIQIKSNLDEKDFTNKISYLSELEIPFFLGLVNQEKNHSITFYSGEGLPFLFSDCPEPNELKFEYCDSPSSGNPLNYEKFPNKKYKLLLPKVSKISLELPEDKLKLEIRKLMDICKNVRHNLARRTQGHYSFKIDKKEGQYIDPPFESLPSDRIAMEGTPPKLVGYEANYSGSGSEKSFRSNFISHVKATINNLSRLIEVSPEKVDKREIQVLRNLYSDLSNLEFYKEKLKGIESELGILTNFLDD